MLAEQVAASLVARAHDLFDARELRDAKQLAVEALVTSGQGPSAAAARALIHQINQQLGIQEEQPVVPRPIVKPQPQQRDAEDHIQITKPPPPALPSHHGAGYPAAVVHAGIYTGLLGATIGVSVADDSQAGVGAGLGVAGAAAGAMFLAPVLDRNFDEAQIRTIGSGTIWGGVIGGMIGDIATGVNTGTSASAVMIGASIGSTVGGLGGYGLASQHKLTRGDVALVDTLAAIGTFGGITVGMVMQPAQSQAYDLNAVLGAAGGVIVGLAAAPKTNTTQRRMIRVAEYAAVGGAAPMLLWAATGGDTSSGTERGIGALSTLGLVGGALLGFHATAGWDEGKDVPDGANDAPPAIVGRASDGRWGLSAPGLAPLSPQLDNHQHGVGVTLASMRF